MLNSLGMDTPGVESRIGVIATAVVDDVDPTSWNVDVDGRTRVL
jgi:hypothetical protein